MKYNTDYFINKFEAIPGNMWTTGSGGMAGGNKKKCALGHCGGWVNQSRESLALSNILSHWYINPRGLDFNEFVYLINDGLLLVSQEDSERLKKFTTPKQRILAALYDIKASEAVREVQEIVNQPIIEQKQLAKA